MRFQFKSAFLIIVVLCVCLSGFSMEDSHQKNKKDVKNDVKKESPIHLHEEIVVTATMTRKAVRDCSASVSIIDETDIKAIASSNSMNILMHLPGLFVRKTGDFGRSDVDIRGIGQRGRRIAVLVDGRPEKMGIFGCAVTHSFPLDNVERIEVVRGPSSVLYGSDAMGGVINILTREPKKKFETEFNSSYGNFNTLQMNLKHGGKNNKFIYYFTLDKRKSDGHRANSSYSGNAFTGKIIFAPSEKFKISLRGKYFSGKKYEAGPIDFPLIDFWNDYNRGAVDLTLDRKGERDELFAKIYRNFGHHRFSDGWHSRDFINGAVFRFTSRRIRNNELTAGVEYRFISGKSYNWPQGMWNKNEASLFIYDEFALKEKWIFSAGLRLHRDSLYGYELCPHIGVVFLPSEKTRLRGMVNKGFRSPQLNELFIFPAANTELEPERVWNYELGFEQKLGSRLLFSSSFFRMVGSGLVETMLNDSPPPKYLFMNSGNFIFRGVELGLSAKLHSKISADLFFTFLDPGEKTKGRPGQKWDISLIFQENILFLSLQTQFISRYFARDFSQSPLPSYLLINGRARVRLTRFLDVFLDFNNILNTDCRIYLELPGLASGIYPMPGRNIHFGISLKQ